MQSGGTLRRPSNSAYDEQNYQQKHQSKNVNCTGNNGAAMWLATTSAEQSKNKYQDQNNKNCNNEVTESENNHFDIADPPLEYSELPRKQNVEV